MPKRIPSPLNGILPKSTYLLDPTGSVRLGVAQILPRISPHRRKAWFQRFIERFAERARRATKAGRAVCVPHSAHADPSFVVSDRRILEALQELARPIVLRPTKTPTFYQVNQRASRALYSGRKALPIREKPPEPLHHREAA